jgi:hypothetical protein
MRNRAQKQTGQVNKVYVLRGRSRVSRRMGLLFGEGRFADGICP